MCCVSGSQATASRPDSLRSLAQARLFGLGVPRALGGSGGDLADLLHAVAEKAESQLPDGIVLASQRLLIEALLQSANIALREYQLPRLLEGDIAGNCAASWPQDGAVTTVLASDTGRGWRVSGKLPAVPNLQGGWFLVSAPVRFEGNGGYSLALFKSDEDGVDQRPGTLELRHVFLWEDEMLSTDGPPAVERLSHLSQALHAALITGACRQRLQACQASSGRARRQAAVEQLFARAAEAVVQGRSDHTALLALRQELKALVALEQLGQKP